MSEDKIVEGEFVDGPPPGGRPEKPAKRSGSFFHPLSGAVILAADWVFFGLDVASGFLLLALFSVAAFGVVFAAVSNIQRRLAGDDPQKAALKALIGALAAAVPFPITGTVVGGAIIALSGLPKLDDLLKGPKK